MEWRRNRVDEDRVAEKLFCRQRDDGDLDWDGGS